MQKPRLSSMDIDSPTVPGRIGLANCPEIPGIFDVSWLAPTQECAFREFANSIRPVMRPQSGIARQSFALL
jgi:hypothetical protein